MVKLKGASEVLEAVAFALATVADGLIDPHASFPVELKVNPDGTFTAKTAATVNGDEFEVIVRRTGG